YRSWPFNALRERSWIWSRRDSPARLARRRLALRGGGPRDRSRRRLLRASFASQGVDELVDPPRLDRRDYDLVLPLQKRSYNLLSRPLVDPFGVRSGFLGDYRSTQVYQ